MMRNIPFARPYLGKEEREAALEVLNGHVLVHGPKIEEFEKTFANWTNADNSIAVSSCTAGLHLAYFFLNIGIGDEVIVPAMTHVATAHAVEFTGATPIFVDAERNTGNIDLEKLEAAISPNTKAISLVHYLGMPVDMDKINFLAKKYKLFVVEDAALAFGTRFKGVHAGLLGDIGLFSMYPVKHITTLEGGLILSKHPDVLKEISLQRAFGVDRTHSQRKIPGQYDVNMLGFNYRMNELQAAIGQVQIGRLDHFLTKRKENYEIITEILLDTEQIRHFKSSFGNFESSYYCKCIILKKELGDQRTTIINALAEKGIGTSIYYPKPVPDLTFYREKYGFIQNQFPVASEIAYQSIALPTGPHLKNGDADYIGQTFKEIINKIK